MVFNPNQSQVRIIDPKLPGFEIFSKKTTTLLKLTFLKHSKFFFSKIAIT